MLLHYSSYVTRKLQEIEMTFNCGNISIQPNKKQLWLFCVFDVMIGRHQIIIAKPWNVSSLSAAGEVLLKRMQRNSTTNYLNLTK